MRIFETSLAAAAVALLFSPALAATYLVHPDGTGDFPTIQDAIAAAASGDVIELGDGVFVGAGNRDVSFQGKALTVRSQSGDPSVCVLDCQGAPVDLHRGFSFESARSLSRHSRSPAPSGTI